MCLYIANQRLSKTNPPSTVDELSQAITAAKKKN